jgi:2-polyprenyl-3-methyl-5-hydroxy-6-metoxy-1,4-benzoquinol methylase
MVPTYLSGEYLSGRNLLNLSDAELLKAWLQFREMDESGEAYEGRGWYRTEYKAQFDGKEVLDVGCGFGLDGVTFAQNGAKVTFLDIVDTNINLVRRICGLF